MTKEILPIKSEPDELSRRQILDELQKHLDEFDWVYLKSNFEDKELLIKTITDSSTPHAMLAFLASRFTAQTGLEMNVSFKKRLKQWKKEFTRNQQGNQSAISIKTGSGISQFKIPLLGKLINQIRKLFSS